MKIRLFALVFFCGLGLPMASTSATRPRRIVKEYQISLRVIFDSTGRLQAEPLRKLSKALAQQKSYQAFRVTWGDLSPGGGFSATALYNKRSSVLLFYSKESLGETNKVYINYIKYTGVKPWMIHKSVKKIANMSDGGASLFPYKLPQFGCKEIVLKKRTYESH